ncbi:unnamed protein product [Brassica oleracea]
MMYVQTLLGDLNLDIREPAITGTMLKKSAMVLVDQKGTTIEGTLYEELEASNQITMDEDLYGALVGIGELQTYEDEIYGGISHKINFSLINIGFDEIKCVAYGDMAIEFYHLWNSTVSAVVLCVLNFWQIERAEGILYICTFKHMRNIEGFSKFLIEPEITEIQAFRMRMVGITVFMERFQMRTRKMMIIFVLKKSKRHMLRQMLLKEENRMVPVSMEALTDDEFEEFKESSLGVFIKFKEQGFGWASRLVHYMLSFKLDIKKKAFKDKRLPLQLTSQKYRIACEKGLKRFNSEEAIEYRLIIVRPLHIKDDAPLQDES